MKRLKNILLSNIILIITITLVLITYLIPSKIYTKLEDKTFTGTITKYTIKDNKITMEIKGKDKIIANYKTNKELNIPLGTKVKLIGTFEMPKNNTIPNIFNYKKYLKSKNINLIMNTKKIYILDKPNIFYRIKNSLIKLINKRICKKYYYMFILGDKTYLDSNMYDIYKTNGIVHLFAISGMHISIIILILKKLRFNSKLILLFLYFYSFLVMFTPSVLRVTLFFTLKSTKLFKNISNEKTLIIVACILIIINKNIIYDIGFLYSFIITLGLFIIKPKNIIYLSIYSFILAFPITIYNNYEINLLSILINIIVVPFVSVCLFPILLISFILPILDPIAKILLNILEITNVFFSKYSINILFRKPLLIEILLYYILVYLFIKYKKKTILISLIFLLFLYKFKNIFSNNYYIYYLDVGQGDSTTIITPKFKKTILIDTGGHPNSNYSEAKNIISFFKSLNIKKIDVLIITHGDYDHMGEAINLVNSFKVEKVIFNCSEFNDLEQELIKVLDKKKIKYYSCIKELNIDNNKLYFLQTKEYDNENDNSNVIYTKLDGYKFMFMGDASVTTEKEILDKYNLPDIDVLKVGHHGSRTSSIREFIDEINPKYSIISVGKKNRYGHPNKEVLDNLNKSKIYRTDQDGSIMFKIKNNRLKIETCEP